MEKGLAMMVVITASNSLSPVRRGRHDLISETKIVVVAALWFAKDSMLLGRSVFSVYKDVGERRRREEARGPEGYWWRGLAAQPDLPRASLISSSNSLA